MTNGENVRNPAGIEPEQVELFGDVDGLFAPPMLATTPIEELSLPRETVVPAPAEDAVS